MAGVHSEANIRTFVDLSCGDDLWHCCGDTLNERLNPQAQESRWDFPMTQNETTVNPRTGLVELDETECWTLLSTTGFGRLAVVDGHQPDICPVNYMVDDHRIVVRTGPGTKLAAAVISGLAAFEVDSIDEANHSGWSVVVHGAVAEVQDLDGVLAAVGLEIEPWADGEKSRFMMITPSDINGRRIPYQSPC